MMKLKLMVTPLLIVGNENSRPVLLEWNKSVFNDFNDNTDQIFIFNFF
jgi:hypothetical protein